MKALSIKQPWAWLICVGYKDIENRDWRIGRKPSPGMSYVNFTVPLPVRVYLHTGKAPDDNRGFQAAFDILRRLHGQSDANIIWKNYWALGNSLGFIIGEVDITGCVTESSSPWFVGKYGFTLANPRLYEHPVKCPGRLGFFELPAEVVAEIERLNGRNESK